MKAMHNPKVGFSLLLGLLVTLLGASACLRVKTDCPAINSSVVFRGGETQAEIEPAILEYLNQGGTPEQLQDELKILEDKYSVGPSQVITVDTNSDGVREIVLALNFGPLPVAGSYLDIHGNLYIYNCVDSQYDVTKIVAGEFADTLKILAVENLLGSDVPEILIIRRWTYLDSFYEFVEMYMLQDDGWALAFQSPDSRCGIQTELQTGVNGHKELVVMGNNRCPNDTDISLTGKKWIYEFAENEVKLMQEEPFSSP